MALLDSNATHCFLSEQITLLTGLYLDMSSTLDVTLADGEQPACSVVAGKAHTVFSRGFLQC